MTGDGRVRLQLRRRWADGTTHLEWEAVDFLGRLAVLVPRPRINLILYHGVLAPRAAWRSAVVWHATSEDGRGLLEEALSQSDLVPAFEVVIRRTASS